MSTIDLRGQGIQTADTWAESITKVRISRDADFDPEYPWVLDGYNERTHELSEDLDRFATHAAAVAGIPAFLSRNGFDTDKENER